MFRAWTRAQPIIRLLCHCYQWAQLAQSALVNNDFTFAVANQDYRHYFINRFCDLLNTTFCAEHVVYVIDSITQPACNPKCRNTSTAGADR
jgi:hypothetical protein